MNILFITWTRIGDVVLSTGLLSHLIERYPGARITVACGGGAAALFAETPGVVRVVAISKRPWALHWWDVWRAVATTRWSLIIDLRGSLLGHFLVARRRKVLHMSSVPVHRVRQLAKGLGLAEPVAPRLWPGALHRAEALRLLPPGQPVVALGAAANWAGKRWPMERYAELAERLTGRGGILQDGRVAVFGSEGERAELAPLLAGVPEERRIDLVGRVDLLTAFACLEQSELFIGNDTGLMHLAAASGVPTLGLFGPTSETIYGPWGEHCAAVRAPSPPGRRRARADDGYDAGRQMSQLAMETVLCAAESLYREARQDGGLPSPASAERA